MIAIKQLKDASIEDLHAAWQEGFKGYPLNLTQAQLANMLMRRGYDSVLSWGAYDDGKLVSFTMNGIGVYNGIATAYDTSTATIEQYRGKGLATAIFETLLPVLKSRDIKQYVLEVLCTNNGAISVYERQGFKIIRELAYFLQHMDKLDVEIKPVPKQYELKDIDLSYKDEMPAMWDFEPSWQNSFESIARVLDDFKMVGAFAGDKLIAYGITVPESGDITQLAVHADFRRQGIGSGILKALLTLNKYPSVKAISIDTTCPAMAAFFTHNGIPQGGTLYEMILPL